MKNSKKILLQVIYSFCFAAFITSCATKSKVAFSPAPTPAEGYGLVYVYNESYPSALNNISSIHVGPLAANGDDSWVTAYLVAGEYTWFHLKPGSYKAKYNYPANGQSIYVLLTVEEGKANYVKLSFLDTYSVRINNVPEKDAIPQISSYKYWEYVRKDCTLVMNCR